jgi:hypothetical protein
MRSTRAPCDLRCLWVGDIAVKASIAWRDCSMSALFRAASCLDKPIAGIAVKAKIKKHLTARFMRRTFQDLGRQAHVHDFVVRAISGHATTAMQERYSSVAGEEVRSSLAKVISLAGFGRVATVAVDGTVGRSHNHQSGYASGYAAGDSSPG